MHAIAYILLVVVEEYYVLLVTILLEVAIKEYTTSNTVQAASYNKNSQQYI